MLTESYKGKRVLVTGGKGFKGSWLVKWLEKMGATVLTYGHAPRYKYDHLSLFDNTMMKNNATSINGDLLDYEKSYNIISSFNPDLIFHLAAHAIVYKTFYAPAETFSNNIMATVNLLDMARKYNNERNNKWIQGIVCVTTDKVYDNKEWNHAYRETDTLGGLDPYSASKVCVEHVINCYRSQYFPMIATARAGNVIGGGDWSEKRLIPDIIRATLRGESVEIHTPNATRPWQHVLEALHGYLLLGERLMNGNESACKHYNFGPENGELTVMKIAEIANIAWDKIKYEIKEKETHPSMVELLKIDSSNAIKELEWKPILSTEQAVFETIDWYRNFCEYGSVITLKQIERFEKKIKDGGE